MDNASFHRSKLVTAHLMATGMRAIYNIPYSPQYNPIERVWAIIKNRYKRKKLEIVGSGVKLNHERVIRECLDIVKDETVRSICTKTVENYIFKQ
jgi:transposase